MEFNNKKSVSDNLSKYDYTQTDKNSFIEVTEWTNGEGYDITINDKSVISLTCGELDAINYLAQSLQYHD